MSSVNADLRARLAQVDASILELKLRLESLEDTRQSIQRQLDSVVYPVLTLPHEITSEIFLDCLPSLDVDNADEGPPVTKAPLLLLQVCRTWRDIALSTPHLWVHLCLNLQRIPEEVGVHGLERVMTDWFLRAGARPLSLSIHDRLRIRDRDTGQSWAEAIRAALLRHAPRLQSISLRLSRPDLHRLVNIGPFPILETFAVVIPFGDEEERLQILGTAPRLRNLVFRGAAAPSIFLLSYEGLSTVTCESLSPDDFFNLLLCAPSLENFTGGVRDEEIVRLDVVTHGRLQTLHLSDGCYMYFLRLVRLPAVQNIHLGTGIVIDECSDILSFLTRSSASLRRFSTGVYGIPLTTDWFSTSMPYLTDIKLFGPPEEFLPDFFQKLDRARDQGFLPHLQSLVFQGCYVDVDVPLLQALSSRCTTDDEESSMLKLFRVGWPLSLDKAQTTALRALVDRGMSIFVGPDKL